MNRYYYRRESGGLFRRLGRGFFWSFIFVSAPFIILGGIIWFRSQDSQEINQTEESAVLAPSAAVSLIDGTTETPVFRARQETKLADVNGGDTWAVASRQVDGSIFRHTVVAHLPELPEGYVYEGWLLMEEPFLFFSTGLFVLNADGSYGLAWEGNQGQDFQTYSQVIITLEPADSDPAPGQHILEGEFDL